MKTLFLTLIITLLAGCSGMGMRDNTSGGMGTESSSGSSADDYHRDDGFHSWVN